VATWRKVKDLPLFCFDVEARPGPWSGSDFVFRNMLSLAGGPDEHNIDYLAPGFKAKALERWVRPLRESCLVITHNGFRYDLPLLNGSLIKAGLAPLPRLLVSDTFEHLPKRGYAFSASLGNMARRFKLPQQKGSMSEYDWELVYAGDREALIRLQTYNIGDVHATLKLRRRLLELGLLGPPRHWSP
jgi:hypothetical protein